MSPLCMCGCGKPTTKILRSNRYDGSIAGNYRKYLVGHCNRKPLPTAETLKAKIIQAQSGCWEWQGVISKHTGYGLLAVKRKTVGVHRLMYELSVGPIPVGLQIRHKCDNRRCCNPEHLETGTIADNMRDKAVRGRASRGESHHSARITSEDVLRIRKSYLNNVELGKIYGISKTAIRLIRIGKNWKHI